jgi:TPR repeat protein
MYFHGIGVEQNFEQALTLYALSADQGNQVAHAKVDQILEAVKAERSDGDADV